MPDLSEVHSCCKWRRLYLEESNSDTKLKDQPGSKKKNMKTQVRYGGCAIMPDFLRSRLPSLISDRKLRKHV
jgi:hypothetical protein